MPELGEGASLTVAKVLPKSHDQFLQALSIHHPSLQSLTLNRWLARTQCRHRLHLWVIIQAWKERPALVFLGVMWCVCVSVYG